MTMRRLITTTLWVLFVVAASLHLPAVASLLLFGTIGWHITGGIARHRSRQAELQRQRQAAEYQRQIELQQWREQYFAVTGYNYDAIPQAVKNEVWNRAHGRCEDCGSEAFLEYDHVVPRRYGGLNTARNIKLRCKPCHREKTNAELSYYQNADESSQN